MEEVAIKWSECEYDLYWHEEAKIELSQQADKQITEATFQLHNMMLMGIDKVVNDDKLLKLFGMNRNLWPAIKYSWKQKQIDMQGRFDLVYDGVNAPKMLEYNADTPSLIIESGDLQLDWFKDMVGENEINSFDHY